MITKDFTLLDQKIDPKVLEAAMFVHTRLVQAGHTCYFAGGLIRDCLLNKEGKDIDLASSASVDEVIPLFDKVIPLGKRFGSVVVVYEGCISIEVTTFREDGIYLDGRHPQSVLESSPEKDAQRRDFTINGLFYDPLKNQIIDYVGGIDDIQLKQLKAIGKASERMEEDRLRMLRAVRFTHRFALTMEKNTRQAIKQLSHDLHPKVSIERVSQEIEKMDHFERKQCSAFLLDSIKLGLFSSLLPNILPLDSLSLVQRSAVQNRLQAIEALPLFEQIFVLFLINPLQSNQDRFPSSLEISHFNLFWKCSKKIQTKHHALRLFLDCYQRDPDISSPVLWKEILLLAGSNLYIQQALDRWSPLLPQLAHGSACQNLKQDTPGCTLQADTFKVRWSCFYESRRSIIANIHASSPLVTAKEMMICGVKQGPLLSKYHDHILDLQLTNPKLDKETALKSIAELEEARHDTL